MKIAMIKKTQILFCMLLIGFALCFTNGFADENGEAIDIEKIIAEGNFAFPTADTEFQRVPDRIIGTPDFEKMRDLPPDSRDYILGRKVGWFVVPQRLNPSRVWLCTGFLVGPDLFMTNHHCIHDASGLLPLEGAAIYMDYYQDRDVDPTRGGITARVSSVLRMDALKDYALLRLDTAIGNTYGWLELDTTTRPNTSQSVKIIQHPDGRSKEIARQNSQIFDIPAGHPWEDLPFALAYLADSEGGSSGSPVFLREGTGVIAIHHSTWNGEPPFFNRGSLMSHIVPEIQQWLPGGAPPLPPEPTVPDLVVEAPEISNRSLRPGESFTLSATVRNLGGVAASATTLRFYESSDSRITTADVEVDIAFVGSLTSGSSSQASTTLTAPISLGTYYYGACVDPVTDEGNTVNNCSTAATLTVSTTPAPTPTANLMYWTDEDTGKIQRANLDGGNVQDLLTQNNGLDNPNGIALDTASGKMYWTDTGTDKIQRANLDGSNIEDLVADLSLFRPDNLALDIPGGKIYWAEWVWGNIRRANLDGSNVEYLVTGLDGPYGIAVDGAGGKVYWTDWGSSKIQRSNLNGTSVEDLVTGLEWPRGIALDRQAGKMYWTDDLANKIQRANLDGSNVQDLVTRSDGLRGPGGIALDVQGGKMYWTDDLANKIQRANLDGSHIEDLVTTGLISPYAIALGISQPIGTIPITFNPSTIADQTFTVGTSASLNLPIATGGTEPYTYTLSPTLPAGLRFDAVNRSISGTPTTAVGATRFTYTASDATGASAALNFTITVTDSGLPVPPPPGPDPLDVNADGQVDVLDLVLVAVFYGTRGNGLPADVNADGIVNVQDFAAVAAGVDAANALPIEAIEQALLAAAEQAAALEVAAEAPAGFEDPPRAHLSVKMAYGNVADALVQTRHLAATDARLGEAVALLETLLSLLAEMGTIPETTALLPNYPNPFNPETWIPYHLSKDTQVILTIHDVRGVLVRELTLGHQPAGVYESRGRAAYWDGRNTLGEPVASGLYFYSLTAGDFTATRKLLIRK